MLCKGLYKAFVVPQIKLHLTRCQDPLINYLEFYAVANLDIAENLFDSWDTVSKMCKQLKKLKNLNVSESRLSFPENEEDMVSGSDFLKKKFSCSLKFSIHKGN